MITKKYISPTCYFLHIRNYKHDDGLKRLKFFTYLNNIYKQKNPMFKKRIVFFLSIFSTTSYCPIQTAIKFSKTPLIKTTLIIF